MAGVGDHTADPDLGNDVGRNSNVKEKEKLRENGKGNEDEKEKRNMTAKWKDEERVTLKMTPGL